MDDDDSELQAIRAKRLAELQKQHQGQAGQREDQEKQRQLAEEQRRLILVQVLTPEARERLSRVALVKPEIAKAVEDYCIRTAQSQQSGAGYFSQIDDASVIQILNKISEQRRSETKITFKRVGDD